MPLTPEQAVGLGLEEPSGVPSGGKIDPIALGLEPPTGSLPAPPADPGFLAGAAKPFKQALSGVTQVGREMLRNPLDLSVGLRAFGGALAGDQAAREGEYQKMYEAQSLPEAVGRGITGTVPFIGPIVGNVADTFAKGNLREGTGQLASELLLALFPYGKATGLAGKMGKALTGAVPKGTGAFLKGAAREAPILGRGGAVGKMVRGGLKEARKARAAGEALPPTPVPAPAHAPVPDLLPPPPATDAFVSEWRPHVEAMQTRIRAKGGTPLSESAAADEAANLAMRSEQVGPNFGDRLPGTSTPRWQAHLTTQSVDPSTGVLTKTTKMKPQEFATFESGERIPVQDFAKRLGNKKLAGAPTGEKPAVELANAQRAMEQYLPTPKEGPNHFTTGDGDNYLLNVKNGKVTDFAVVDGEGTLTRRVRGGRHDPSLASKGMDWIMDVLYETNVKLDPAAMSEGAIKSWLKYLKHKIPAPPKK